MTVEEKKALEIQQQEEKQQKFRDNMAMYAARYEENQLIEEAKEQPKQEQGIVELLAFAKPLEKDQFPTQKTNPMLANM